MIQDRAAIVGIGQSAFGKGLAPSEEALAVTAAGGGGGCAAVGLGAMAIAAGQADVVVAWRARRRSSAASRVWAGTAERVRGREMWVRPAGLVRPVDEIAMLARRHMALYGT